MATPDPFDVKFTSREVSAWGGLARLKRMPGGMDFKSAMQSWGLPKPGSNRGYAPEQLIEQMIVSIWCGAARFCHADITRLDSTLIRLFGWGRAAGHKAIVRLFRADSGFYDKAIVDQCQWQQVAPGLQVSQLRYQPHGWDEAKRLPEPDQGTQGRLWTGQLCVARLLGHRGGVGREHAGLQLDECVWPHGDASKGSPHTGHPASQGAGRGCILGEPQGKTQDTHAAPGAGAPAAALV